jgi:hypothetical protein
MLFEGLVKGHPVDPPELPLDAVVGLKRQEDV